MSIKDHSDVEKDKFFLGIKNQGQNNKEFFKSQNFEQVL